MKIPSKPLPFDDLLERVSSTEVMLKVFSSEMRPTIGGKYRHWDVVRHLDPPADLTTEEWWMGIKFARNHLYQQLPAMDKEGQPFKYAAVDLVFKALHEIDRDAGGVMIARQPILDSDTRDAYYMKSLFEEAITSSQLEGAVTTRQVAKQMLREGRKPRDRAEQMIYNNYRVMRFIQEIKGETLNEQIIIELQRILTTDTLDDPSGVGRYRKPDEDYKVYDDEGHLLHDPPAASELKARLAALCEFANTEDYGDVFIHPVVRAILLHFWLAYEHPFIDGNGRTARALFYWSMARQGYWLMEYLSISSILRRAPAQYARSFLYAETDDNDLTYFIIDQLRVIQRAIQALHLDLKKKMEQIHETELLLRGNHLLLRSLNHRQLALLNHGLRHAGTIYSIQSHRNSNNITYQTARTDLLKLADLGLLEQFKRSRKYFFRIPADLKERVNKVSIQTDRMEFP